MLASYTSSRVYATVENAHGDNVLDEELLTHLKFFGQESNGSLFFRIKNLSTVPSGKVLSISSDLPNSDKYSRKDYFDNAKFFTKFSIKYKNQIMQVTCVYKYSVSPFWVEDMYGGTGIEVDQVICDGLVFERKTNIGYVLLPLVLENDRLSVKK